MKRVRFIAVGCLILLTACSEPSTSDGPPVTSATVAPTSPATTPPTATTPAAPTDCREAPQLPACRPDHEEK